MKDLTTKLTGAGSYKITLYINYENVGSFETTNMTLIDDIHTIKDGGNNEELMNYDSFDEIIEYCESQIDKFVICDNDTDKYMTCGDEFTSDYDNATIFTTESEALEYIQEMNWESWASIINLR